MVTSRRTPRLGPKELYRGCCLQGNMCAVIVPRGPGPIPRPSPDREEQFCRSSRNGTPTQVWVRSCKCPATRVQRRAKSFRVRRPGRRRLKSSTCGRVGVSVMVSSCGTTSRRRRHRAVVQEGHRTLRWMPRAGRGQEDRHAAYSAPCAWGIGCRVIRQTPSGNKGSRPGFEMHFCRARVMEADYSRGSRCGVQRCDGGAPCDA